MTRLIALSASYGAGGSVIGPAVAERLGVPFVDRAIPLAVSEKLAVAPEYADPDETAGASGGFLERVLSSFASAEPLTGPMPLAAEVANAEEFRRATEEVLRRQAAAGAGVILGRGAVCVLRDDPRVLRVRLDGPPEERVRQAMRLLHLERDEAERGRKGTDRTRADYMRRFYGADPRDPALYHLMLDGTALPAQECVEIIARAAAAL